MSDEQEANPLASNLGAVASRTAQINPRQLNFADEHLEGAHGAGQVDFENVDDKGVPENHCEMEKYHKCQNRPQASDNEEDHFEVVKIKLNSH